MYTWGMAKNKRPQSPKPNRHERVLELRRGSRTAPVPSGKRYTRKVKHTGNWEN